MIEVMKGRLVFFKNKNEALRYLNKTKVTSIFPSLSFWKAIAFSISFLRLIVPIFIFFQPLFVFIVFTFLDLIDYGFLKTLRITERKYHLIDKPLDLYSQLFMMLYGLRTEYSILFLSLFIYRALGTAAFLITDRHLFLLIFPNLIEVIFLSYVLLSYFDLNFLQLFGILVALKMVQEFLLHALIFHFPSAILETKIGKKYIQIQVS